MQPTDKTWSWSANVIAFLPSKMRVLLLPFLHQTPSLYQNFGVQQFWKNAIFQHSTKPRLCALENIIMNHDEEGQDDNDLEKKLCSKLSNYGRQIYARAASCKSKHHSRSTLEKRQIDKKFALERTQDNYCVVN